jgi:hypothetical protein
MTSRTGPHEKTLFFRRSEIIAVITGFFAVLITFEVVA